MEHSGPPLWGVPLREELTPAASLPGIESYPLFRVLRVSVV